MKFLCYLGSNFLRLPWIFGSPSSSCIEKGGIILAIQMHQKPGWKKRFDAYRPSWQLGCRLQDWPLLNLPETFKIFGMTPLWKLPRGRHSIPRDFWDNFGGPSEGAVLTFDRKNHKLEMKNLGTSWKWPKRWCPYCKNDIFHLNMALYWANDQLWSDTPSEDFGNFLEFQLPGLVCDGRIPLTAYDLNVKLIS